MVLKKILVTGATGVLGRQIIKSFTLAGWQTISCGRQKPNWIENYNWRRLDLSEQINSAYFDKICDGLDAIVHAGAAVPSADRVYTEDELLRANVVSTNAIANYCHMNGIPLVYVSGAIVYHDCYRVGIKEEDALGYNSIGGFYGLTKLHSDQLIEFYRNKGLKAAILRPSSIYGVGLPNGKLVRKLLSSLINDRCIQLSPPVNNKVDLVNSYDVANAIKLVIDKDWYNIANIASDSPISLIELARMCVSVIGYGTVEVLPSDSPEDNTHSNTLFSLNTRRIREKVGWYPKIPIYEGLQEIADEIIEYNMRMKN